MLQDDSPKDPKKSRTFDLQRVLSLGTVFLYSNKYLEDGYAEFLAEEQDVGAVMNP